VYGLYFIGGFDMKILKFGNISENDDGNLVFSHFNFEYPNIGYAEYVDGKVILLAVIERLQKEVGKYEERH